MEIQLQAKIKNNTDKDYLFRKPSSVSITSVCNDKHVNTKKKKDIFISFSKILNLLIKDVSILQNFLTLNKLFINLFDSQIFIIFENRNINIISSYNNLIVICYEQFCFIIKILCRKITNKKRQMSLFNLDQFRLKENSRSYYESFNEKTAKSEYCNSKSNLKSYKIINLFKCYFMLLNDYDYVEIINFKLLQEIKEFNVKSNLQNINNRTENCEVCWSLKKHLDKVNIEYNNIRKSYSVCKLEKERMVVKYATSEKHLIEIQRCIKLKEKNHQDSLKENIMMQKKITNMTNEIANLTNLISGKCSEISNLKNQIQYYRNNENAKEIKLKCLETRLLTITEDYQKTQIRANKSEIKSRNLTTECKMLRSQINSIFEKAQETKITAPNEQFEHLDFCPDHDKTKFVEISCRNHQTDSNSNVNKEFVPRKEEDDVASQIHTLERNCMDYKSQLGALNLSLRKEKENVFELMRELSEVKISNQTLESMNHHLSTIANEVSHLQLEKAELQADVEAYRQREIQILDFIQKLTDKNVQLQCEMTEMQAKVRDLESVSNPMSENINKYIKDIHDLTYNLSCEKLKRKQECEILVKYIAKQALHNVKLSNQLEDSQGKNNILQKKCESAIRKLNYRLHQCRKKN